jgi:hypothetical protein
MKRARAFAEAVFFLTFIQASSLFAAPPKQKLPVVPERQAQNTPRQQIIDYDGDKTSDISVFSLEERTLYRKGLLKIVKPPHYDFPLPICGDYNGDGKTDIAYFDKGYWLIVGQLLTNVGAKGDLPVPGDYDGDGKTDLATWTPSNGTWTFRNQPPVRWGEADDVPVPVDYDGDGKTDIAVWRPAEGNWYIHYTAGKTSVIQLGTKGDIPVPADYDGDGKTNIAVWRPTDGTWYIQDAKKGTELVILGVSGDIPVPGDYNGDGRIDAAVWRPEGGKWYIKGQKNIIFGRPRDIPIAWNIWIIWSKKLLPAAAVGGEVSSLTNEAQTASCRNGLDFNMRKKDNRTGVGR